MSVQVVFSESLILNYVIKRCRIRSSSPPAGLPDSNEHHEDDEAEAISETQGMVMEALDTVFAKRRAATQGRSGSASTPTSTASAARTSGLQTRRAARAAGISLMTSAAASPGQGLSISSCV